MAPSRKCFILTIQNETRLAIFKSDRQLQKTNLAIEPKSKTTRILTVISTQFIQNYLQPSYSLVSPFGKNFNFNCSKYRNPKSVESPQGSKYLFDLIIVRWPDGATETQWTLGVFQCNPVLQVAKSPFETRSYTFPLVT